MCPPESGFFGIQSNPDFSGFVAKKNEVIYGLRESGFFGIRNKQGQLRNRDKKWDRLEAAWH